MTSYSRVFLGHRAAPLSFSRSDLWNPAFMKHCEVCLKIQYKHRLSQNYSNECMLVTWSTNADSKVHELILDLLWLMGIDMVKKTTYLVLHAKCKTWIHKQMYAFLLIITHSFIKMVKTINLQKTSYLLEDTSWFLLVWIFLNQACLHIHPAPWWTMVLTTGLH